MAGFAAGAVLEDINSLPCSQRQFPIIHGNGQACICQHGADVGSGIVWTFQIVCIPTITFRDKTLHEGFKIGAGSRVPVFAHDQGSARVLEKEKAHAFLHSPITQLRVDGMGYIVKPFALG